MFGNIYAVFLSILLLPACIGTGSALVRLSISIHAASDVQSPWTYFICGAITYIAAQLVFFRPLRLYVFGHELAHAIAGWISGARIRAINVKKSSGSVSLDKVNIFIALAPYFFPFYSVLLILFYALFNILTKNVYNVNNYFLFLLGMSTAFHVALTIYAINLGQSDLEKYGVIFSLIIIFISNCIVLAVMLAVFFHASFPEFVYNSAVDTIKAYAWIYARLRVLKDLL